MFVVNAAPSHSGAEDEGINDEHRLHRMSCSLPQEASPVSHSNATAVNTTHPSGAVQSIDAAEDGTVQLI